MLMRHKPVVGSWYQTEDDETFEVVAFDQEEGTIEIQYFDGTVEEMDLETWCETVAKSIDPPEDWTGSYDIESEDAGVELNGLGGGDHDWQNSIDDL